MVIISIKSLAILALPFMAFTAALEIGYVAVFSEDGCLIGSNKNQFPKPQEFNGTCDTTCHKSPNNFTSISLLNYGKKLNCFVYSDTGCEDEIMKAHYYLAGRVACTTLPTHKPAGSFKCLKNC
jgi:hypothetical protein